MVDNLSPDWGDTDGGTEVKIIGKNFIPRSIVKSKWKDHVIVTFDNIRCSKVEVLSDTEIICETPRATESTSVLFDQKAKKKDAKKKYLPVRVEVIINSPEGYFKSSEHIDGGVRLHNDYIFTYFPPDKDIYGCGYYGDSSDDFENEHL